LYGDHSHEPVPFVVSTAYSASRIENIGREDEQEPSFKEENDFLLHSMRDGVDAFDEIS
jgi:hypothetical protein